MKAMILAAGKGTRVRPLTHVMPKPMIPVLGKPVMEYLVEHLARHGFDQIMVNVSHLHTPSKAILVMADVGGSKSGTPSRGTCRTAKPLLCRSVQQEVSVAFRITADFSTTPLLSSVVTLSSS